LHLRFLEQGLHNTPDILRTELQAAIDAADDCGYDSILIGYGLCSNGIDGIRARKTKLVIIRAHDCITFFLGSRKRYREYFDSHPGTYWYNAGWIDAFEQPGRERYENTLKLYTGKYGEEDARYLMQAENEWYSRYNNAVYIDEGFPFEDKYRQFTRECAAWLKWDYEEMMGDPVLIWDLLQGNWDKADYLVIEPGCGVRCNFDEDSLISSCE